MTRSFRLPLIFLILLSIRSIAMAQDETTLPSPPHAYHFTADTVWAKISVLVIDLNGSFQLECTGDNPLEGWVLTHRPTNTVVNDNQDNDSDSFRIKVNKPFDDYELTVFVNGQDAQIPMIVDLAPDKKTAYTLPLYAPFEENSNRPYNTLVKSLYDQAGQAYIQGDTEAAIDLLEKALKVDATEPQVLAFLNKLQPQSPTDNTSEQFIANTLVKAQKAEADKDFHEARSAYADVLKVDPKNSDALEGIQRIETQLLKDAARLLESYIKDGDYPKAKTMLAKIEQAFPKDERIKDWREKLDQMAHAGSPGDRKAKADETYNLGLESYRKDDFASAKKFWEETLQIDPQYIQAQQNLNRLTEEHPGLQ